MRALICPPGDELRRLRRTVADAIERLRALDLAPGDPAIAGEVACTALAALSTVLFASGDNSGPHVPVRLVEDEIHQIAVLLSVAPKDVAEQPKGCVCLSGGLRLERTAVSP